jgi:uncharacterized protein with PQ loop repeat
LVRTLDYIVYGAGILGPLATFPQVYQIYSTHNASGLSLLTWSTYAFLDIPFIIYAFVHREPPLIVCYSLWFVFNLAVAIGVLLYGGSMSF